MCGTKLYETLKCCRIPRYVYRNIIIGTSLSICSAVPGKDCVSFKQLTIIGTHSQLI